MLISQVKSKNIFLAPPSGQNRKLKFPNTWILDKPEMTRSQPRDGRPEGKLDDILGMRETKPDRLRKRSSSMRNPTARIRRIERVTRQEGDPGRDGRRRGEGPAAESQFEGEVDGILRPFEEMRRRDDVDG